MDELPEVVGIYVLDGAGPDLDLCHWYQDLVADDLNLCRIGLGGCALEIMKWEK